ncbi:MAG: hypothetical protein WCI55_13325 [Armatimonadota bacterium]
MRGNWTNKGKTPSNSPTTDFGEIYPILEEESARKSASIVWPNRAKCAVSFAYIGGLQEHADLAPPVLEQLGFRASFYVDPDVVLEDAALWKKLAGSRHEFGCSPFESQTFDGNLYGWTTAGLIDELNLSKEFVQDFFDAEPKGLAHRSSELTIADKNVSLIAQNLFKHVVTGTEGINRLSANVKNLSITPVVGYSSNWLADLGQSNELSWVIIPFRRLFAESNASILLHRLILENISRKRRNLWIAPVGEVASEFQKLRSSVD